MQIEKVQEDHHVINSNNNSTNKRRQIDKEDYFDTLDVINTPTRHGGKLENTLEYIPIGAKTGKLPGCVWCSKSLNRKQSRVAWYSKFIKILPNGKRLTSRVSASYICPKVSCIASYQKKINLFSELLCNFKNLTNEHMALKSALKC
jgi:hypothetical protein